MKYSLILLASGQGKRFGSSIPKWRMSLNGKPVIQYSLDIIEPLVDEVIIVANEQYRDYKCVLGGNTRSKSVQQGLKHCTGDYVIVHDSVRPFVTVKQIEQIKELLKTNYVVDTISPIIDGYVEDGLPKDKTNKFLGLTPEGFSKNKLDLAFKKAKRDYQDEVTMIYDVLKIKPVFVQGTSFNSKITFEEDLSFAEGIMKFWQKPIDNNLKYKFTLVLGGSGGIGQACIKKLKQYHAPSRQELDLSTDWTIALDDYQAIIYTAGEYTKDIMEVNFNSCVKLIELAEAQNWQGNIVFLSSTASTYGRERIGLYSASKAALNAYIESRAKELADKGIYINAIAPAKVDTKLQAIINPKTPKEDMMTPDYVANYVLRYTNTNVSGHIVYLRKGFDDYMVSIRNI